MQSAIAYSLRHCVFFSQSFFAWLSTAVWALVWDCPVRICLISGVACASVCCVEGLIFVTSKT